MRQGFWGLKQTNAGVGRDLVLERVMVWGLEIIVMEFQEGERLAATAKPLLVLTTLWMRMGI